MFGFLFKTLTILFSLSFFNNCYCLFYSKSVLIPERITHFDSNLRLDKRGSLQVQETIKVVSTGDRIRHGIFRDFPTVYFDRWRLRHTLPIKLDHVLLDNYPVDYHREQLANGERFFIGDQFQRLSAGSHTYSLSYTVANSLIVDEHEALFYWNAIGTGWRFPIERATITLQLPENISGCDIVPEVFVGYQGERSSSATMICDPLSQLHIETTRPLKAGEGVTVKLLLPATSIIAPTFLELLGRLLYDNRALLLLGTVFLCLLMFYVWRWKREWPYKQAGTIIPRFYPPALSPAAVRYMYKRSYDATALASDIVGMAVAGLITISYEKKWWKSSYTLTKKQEPTEQSFSDYNQLYKILFSQKPQVLLDRADSSDRKTLSQASQTLSSYCLNSFMGGFLVTNTELLATGILISIAAFPTALMMAKPAPLSSIWLFISVALYSCLNLLFAWLLQSYTKEGRKLLDEIEGFKLFLTTTETERLAVIGTPPTKNPELFEKYLPYAIALGVEKQWSEQFAPIFARLEDAHMAYVPIWFIGGSLNNVLAGSLAHDLTSSLGSVAASASSWPGTSGGSGGRGSSGGGLGGGGGGGW